MVLIRSVTKDCLRKVTFVFEGPWNLFYFESVINKSGIHFLLLFTPQVEKIHFHQELFKNTILTNEGKERWRKKAPDGNQSHDHWVIRHVFYPSATTAAPLWGTQIFSG